MAKNALANNNERPKVLLRSSSSIQIAIGHKHSKIEMSKEWFVLRSETCMVEKKSPEAFTITGTHI